MLGRQFNYLALGLFDHLIGAASDARVTKAVSSIAVALLLISSGASATECQSSPGHDGKWWSYRIVDSKRCWYQGQAGPPPSTWWPGER